MENKFAQLEVLIWLCDILGHAKTYREHLSNLQNAVEIFATRGLRLNPNECKLAPKDAQFCGRIVDGNGMRFHPRNYNALISELPKQ